MLQKCLKVTVNACYCNVVETMTTFAEFVIKEPQNQMSDRKQKCPGRTLKQVQLTKNPSHISECHLLI